MMKRIWAYHAVVFLGAFLLFQVQPMTSKALLPGLGGSYLVWGACMVFYQVMLLLGYVYAHALQKRFGVGRYARLHWVVLLAALAVFPLRLGRLGALPGSMPLVVTVFTRLLATVGLPLLALATTGVLLQRWLSASDLEERSNPYVLYGASNLGSMLALLSYPVLAEPLVGLETQGRAWCVAYGLLVALHGFCMPPRGSGEESDAGALPRLRTSERAGWVWLGAAACAALLAVTNVITFDVASVPFLWVLPLALYLLSFVLTFKRHPWCPAWARQAMYWASILGVLLYLCALFHLGLPVWLSIALHLGVLFFVCLNCTGRLIERKPDDVRHLTSFYLHLALGGALGGVLVSWVLPLVSNSLVEYPLALCLAVGALAWTQPPQARWPARRMELPVCIGCVALALTVLPLLLSRLSGVGAEGSGITLVAVAVPVALVLLWMAGRPAPFAVVLVVITVAGNWTEDLASSATRVRRLRNYYGVYRVFERDNLRYLQHGSTLHGRQYLGGPERHTPLAYYHPTTPAAGVMASPAFRLRDIGMVGLGTGALAGYVSEGQTLTVYELDPDNLRVAEQNFTYLADARRRGARLQFVFGDGRVSLRSRAAESLDLLVIDAFNSGSIPVHLLTVEAIHEYLRVLRPDGVALFHVSNKVLSLRPVLYSNARAAGAVALEKSNDGARHPDAEDTYWMALARDGEALRRLGRLEWTQGALTYDRLPRPWTDRYSNVLGAMVGR